MGRAFGLVVLLATGLGCIRPAPASVVPDGPALPPHHRVDVVELAEHANGPRWVPWLDEATGRPLRLVDPRLTVAVDPRVAEGVGRTPVEAGLTAFNGVPGSAVEVTMTVAPTADVDAMVEVVEVACNRLGGDQGRARPRVDDVGPRAAWVGSARIEVCPDLATRSHHFVRHLMAHELAHVLGFGHLCNDPQCWPLEQRATPCEFMYPSVHPCQDLGSVRAVLPRLYPRPRPSAGETPLGYRQTSTYVPGSSSSRSPRRLAWPGTRRR